jgi:hypothetical protein
MNKWLTKVSFSLARCSSFMIDNGDISLSVYLLENQ